MGILKNFTPETLAAALRELAGPGGAAEADAIWSMVETDPPHDVEDVAHLAEDVADRVLGPRVQDAEGPGREQTATFIRDLLPRFVEPTVFEEVMAFLDNRWSHGQQAMTTSAVKAWRGRWREENPEEYRRERMIWSVFAALSTAAVVVWVAVSFATGGAAGDAFRAGSEALIVVLVVGGLMGVVLRNRRGEPDDGRDTKFIDTF